MQVSRLLSGESDIWVGRRTRLKRHLVTAMEGFFPVVVRTGPHHLAAIYRTGAPHVGITGTLAVSTSEDGGKSWSDSVQVQPRWDDTRNPALGVNAQGELVAAFWKARLHCYQVDSAQKEPQFVWSGEEQPSWRTIPSLHYCKSADGGRTWGEVSTYMSETISCGSPYGRIISAPDGTLLMAFYGRAREPLPNFRDTSILLRSTDGGATWGDESVVAHEYNETSYAFLPGGELLAAARSESGHVATLHSSDGGRTWSQPVQVTRDGEHPADLTVLQSGRVLLTFGRRIRPMGCGALLSEDGGHTWNRDREVLLAGDGIENGDLGLSLHRATGRWPDRDPSLLRIRLRDVQGVFRLGPGILPGHTLPRRGHPLK